MQRARSLFPSLVVASLAALTPPAAEARPPQNVAAPPCGGLAEPVSTFFSEVGLVLPEPRATDVPRNAVLRLSGDPDALSQQGLIGPFTLRLEDDDGAAVPFTREGTLVRPAGLLEPDTTYTLTFDDEWCPGCAAGRTFTTGSAIDVTAPRLEALPRAHVLVGAHDERCVGDDMLFLDLGAVARDAAWVEVGLSRPGGAAQPLFATLASLVRQSARSLGQLQLGLGDGVLLAVTPVDLAGNVGPARIIKARGRAFSDIEDEVWSLEPAQCTMPEAPVLHAPSTLPANGLLQVDFPFEAVPLALERDGAQIPLHPAVTTSGGHVLEPASALEPGASYDLVGLPCAHCVCRGCALGSSAVSMASIAVGPADEAPPDAPGVLYLDEDLDPERATGACRPDRTSLLVVLEPGTDNVAAAGELRYDAVLRLEGKLPVQVGRHLAPAVRADGTVVLRLETTPLGRLLPEAFTLELLAIDLAGNRSATVTVEHAAAGGGCAAGGAGEDAGFGFGLLALAGALGLAMRRKRA